VKARRIALDTAITFAVTFGAFYLVGRPIGNLFTLLGIILIWAMGALLSAIAFRAFVDRFVHRRKKKN